MFGKQDNKNIGENISLLQSPFPRMDKQIEYMYSKHHFCLSNF